MSQNLSSAAVEIGALRVNLKGIATLKASESEMQALIKPCNLWQTLSKLNEK